MASLEQKIEAIIGSTIKAMGFELVGIELIRAGRFITLRIYIDQEAGVSVDDCATVSRQISALLDVEDPISDKYTLEVSSPGLDRPLFTLEHFKRFIGEKVVIHLRIAIEQRRKYTGVIVEISDQNVGLMIDNIKREFAFANIQRAQLVPTF